MRLTILTVGTRGEVDPCLALGQGLQRAGYSVTVATAVEIIGELIAGRQI